MNRTLLPPHQPSRRNLARRTVGALTGVFLIWFVAHAAEESTAAPPQRRDRGYAYLHDQVPDVPWSIHIFKVSRAHRELELCTTLGGGAEFGMASVSDQVRTVPSEAGQPLAAINGDFYNRGQYYTARPRDLQVRLGELVTRPSKHCCFWVDAAGEPHMTNVASAFQVIWSDGATTPLGLNEELPNGGAVLYTAALGRSTQTGSGMELVLERGTNSAWLPLQVGQVYAARVREIRSGGDAPLTRQTMVLSLGPLLAPRFQSLRPGATLRITTQTSPELAGVKTAIGGGPALVREGKALQFTGVQLRQFSGVRVRHPRTAIGWNKDSIFLVEVDGRQFGLSVGMTMAELAAYMVKLGCEEAMNLDGGGSATLWAMGQVMNSPSEGHERPSPNALVVIRKPSPPN